MAIARKATDGMRPPFLEPMNRAKYKRLLELHPNDVLQHTTRESDSNLLCINHIHGNMPSGSRISHLIAHKVDGMVDVGVLEKKVRVDRARHDTCLEPSKAFQARVAGGDRPHRHGVEEVYVLRSGLLRWDVMGCHETPNVFTDESTGKLVSGQTRSHRHERIYLSLWGDTPYKWQSSIVFGV